MGHTFEALSGRRMEAGIGGRIGGRAGCELRDVWQLRITKVRKSENTKTATGKGDEVFASLGVAARAGRRC